MTIMSRFEISGGRRERGPSMIRATRRVMAAAVFLVAALSASGDSQANTVTLSAYAQQSVIAATLKSTVPPELAPAVTRAPIQAEILLAAAILQEAQKQLLYPYTIGSSARNSEYHGRVLAIIFSNI